MWHARLGDWPWGSGSHRIPAPCHLTHFTLVFRPIVQRGRVEVGSVGPYERACLWIDLDAIKQSWILQWAVNLASEDRPKVDGLRRAILKANAKDILGDHLK